MNVPSGIYCRATDVANNRLCSLTIRKRYGRGVVTPTNGPASPLVPPLRCVAWLNIPFVVGLCHVSAREMLAPIPNYGTVR